VWSSPYINHFLQPDSLIPDLVNPQAWNRYSYVGNRPVNFSDPTGHCPEEMAECRKILSDLLPKPTTSRGKLPIKDNGYGKQGCSYHLCSDTNLYTLGWENFGQASSILTNPNATYGQKFGAGAYIGAWGGAHLCLIVCTGAAAAEYLVPGSITCLMMLKCAESIFWSGGDVARNAAESYAKSTGKVTLEMTIPGRTLDLVGKVIPYQYLKPFWDFASGQFARGASGDINAFLYPPGYNPGGTWATIEEVALQANSNVINIIKNIVP
jgi:hypothetical protein